MGLDATMSNAEGIATVVLAGEADSETAPMLNELITTVTATPVRQLVLDVRGLTYLSSAGLRSLVFAHQTLGRGVEIVLVGARPEVARTIRLTGFDRSVTLADEVPT
jgi:anti-anti-sigma factor